MIASQLALNFDEIWFILKSLGKNDGLEYWNDLLKLSYAFFGEYARVKTSLGAAYLHEVFVSIFVST